MTVQQVDLWDVYICDMEDGRVQFTVVAHTQRPGPGWQLYRESLSWEEAKAEIAESTI